MIGLDNRIFGAQASHAPKVIEDLLGGDILPLDGASIGGGDVLAQREGVEVTGFHGRQLQADDGAHKPVEVIAVDIGHIVRDIVMVRGHDDLHALAGDAANTLIIVQAAVDGASGVHVIVAAEIARGVEDALNLGVEAAGLTGPDLDGDLHQLVLISPADISRVVPGGGADGDPSVGAGEFDILDESARRCLVFKFDGLADAPALTDGSVKEVLPSIEARNGIVFADQRQLGRGGHAIGVDDGGLEDAGAGCLGIEAKAVFRDRERAKIAGVSFVASPIAIVTGGELKLEVTRGVGLGLA